MARWSESHKNTREANLNIMKKGIYISVEGVVGSGKTTKSKLLHGILQDRFPKRKVIWTHEPGGSEIADEIRRVVQGMIFKEEMDPVCEQYLYAASRAQTLRKIVKPVLDDGGIVIADRSFVTSIAFQGFGRGLGIERVLKINEEALGGIWPDRIFFIDLDIEKALGRVSDGKGDKFESMNKDFFRKTRKGYFEAAKLYPDIVEVIDGNESFEKVFRIIKSSTLKIIK